MWAEGSEAVEAVIRGRDLMTNGPEGLANLGYVYGAVGRREQSYEVLAELHEISQHRYVPHHMSALVYAGLGDADETLDRLERAYQERSYFMPALGTLPVFDGVRADARFQNLLQRIGLPVQLRGPLCRRRETTGLQHLLGTRRTSRAVQNFDGVSGKVNRSVKTLPSLDDLQRGLVKINPKQNESILSIPLTMLD